MAAINDIINKPMAGAGSGSAAYPPPAASSAPDNFLGSATGVVTNTNDQDALRNQMNANSTAWWTADDATKAALHADNQALAAQLAGSVAYDGGSGIWGGTAAANSPAPVYNIQSASSQTDYINSLYAAQQQAALAALKSAYDQNIIDIDAQAAKIPATYQAARNQTAASAEQQRGNWNEYAAAAGLNNGVGGQAQLAMSNQLLGNMGAINQSEADAVNDLDTTRLKIQTQYQNDIAQAIANGDLARAQALYQEAVRVDESLVATSLAQADENYRRWSANTGLDQYGDQMDMQRAQTLAAYGDFSGYSALGYTDAQIQQMQQIWAAQNPLLAQSIGIAAPTYYSGGGAYSTGAAVEGTKPDPKISNASELGSKAQGVYQQLNTIPGLTGSNKIALVEQAAQNGKISGAEASWLLDYLGY